MQSLSKHTSSHEVSTNQSIEELLPSLLGRPGEEFENHYQSPHSSLKVPEALSQFP